LVSWLQTDGREAIQGGRGWCLRERYDAARIPIGVVAYVTRSAHLDFRPTQLGPCAPRSLCSADAQWPPEDVEAAAGREGSAAPGMSERGGACICEFVRYVDCGAPA
jgi:hypothetical protein